MTGTSSRRIQSKASSGRPNFIRLPIERLESRDVPALVAAYSFGELSGATVQDATSNQNHGTISGATRTPNGRYGSALSFDGVSNLVTIADAATLDLTSGMTLSAWVKPTSVTSWRSVLLKERSPNGLAYSLYASNDLNRAAGYINQGGLDRAVIGPTSLQPNVWTHLAVTFDGTTLRLFVDGSQVASAGQAGSIITSAGPLRIGGNAVWGEYFSGLIDEVRIYNNAQTAIQIQTDMNTPVDVPQDPVPPSVVMTAPQNGATLTGTITVAANASDNIGVAGVQFMLDGVPFGAEDVTAPYSVAFNTATTGNGSHSFSAVARDAAGNTATAIPSSVTVSNSGLALAINGAQTFQTIDGFGVNANAHSWNDGELIPALDMLYDEMGARLFRVVYDMEDWEAVNDNADPNVANWTYYNALYSNASFQELWSTIRYLNQKGVTDGISLSFMGRVPVWMGGSVITPSLESEWVETITTLVVYARNTEHLQFTLLDPLNETDWDGIEGPQANSVQYTRLLNRLSASLDAVGLTDMRLLGPNTASVSAGVNTYMPAMMSDPVVMNKVDHFAFHNYSGDTGGAYAAIQNSPYATRNFWMTEVTNPWDIMAMIGGNPSAILVWDGYDSAYIHPTLHGASMEPPNDAGNGPAPLAYNVSTGIYTRRLSFYQDMQIFKFVPPGSVRIGLVEPSNNLTMYAFHDPASGRVTIVGENSGNSDINLSGSLANLPAVASFDFYKTDSSSNFQQQADEVVNNGAFSIVAPRNSYFTLTALTGPVISVAGLSINDGAAQRSRVTSLTVTFNGAATFATTPAAAFTLSRHGDPVTFQATAALVNGVTVVTINSFSGSETEFGSLSDGRYTLRALASQISANGQSLDGDGNGQSGDDYLFNDGQFLYRYFGETNGDSRVDISDFGAFSLSYNRMLSEVGFNPIFDFNDDGRIDIADFGQFSVRYLTTLP